MTLEVIFINQQPSAGVFSIVCTDPVGTLSSTTATEEHRPSNAIIPCGEGVTGCDAKGAARAMGW